MPGHDQHDSVTTEPDATLGEADTASDVASNSSSGRHDPRKLARGTDLSHFVILDVIGEGGMGIVYSAYDPHLDRQVAIKQLRPDKDGDASTEMRQRLLREAHALAKLNHDNVVAVHEALEVDAQVFVVMEHVSGGTLQTWLQDEPRGWRDVVAMHVLAGRGLSAAHAAGLVHRDFKPDNVLVGDDGRVRVTDFGLVLASGEQQATPRPPGTARAPTAVPLSAELTSHGQIVGTPGYVAPERYRHVRADPRSDQFSFCVSLYEALHGRKPFPGETAAEQAAGLLRGDLVSADPADEIPEWIDRAIRRGLSFEPGVRFQSIDALLAALTDDPQQRRRSRIRLGVAVAAFTGVTAIAAFGLLRSAAPDQRCQSTSDNSQHVWGPAQKRMILAAFDKTNRPYAKQIYRRVSQRLDDYVTRWKSMRVDACRATHIRGEQSERALDARMVCLDRRLREVGALVQLFSAAPDLQVMNRAVHSVAALVDVQMCADTEKLLTHFAGRRRSGKPDKLADELAQARALAMAAKYAAAAKLAEAVISTAATTQRVRLGAAAMLLLGDLRDSLGDAKAAEELLRRALEHAARAHDDELLARSWTALLWVVGYSRAQRIPALELATSARIAVARAGSPPRLTADLAKKLGGVYMRHGDYDGARKQYQRALEIVSKWGTGHPEHGVALGNLGNAMWKQGKLAEARSVLKQGIALDRKTLGKSHPDLAYSLNTLGHVAAGERDWKTAQTYYEQALTLRESSLGPDHPDVAHSLSAVAQALEARGAYTKAYALYRRAITITKKARGPRHPDVAGLTLNAGKTLRHLGKSAEALTHLQQAAEIWKETVGEKHPGIAFTWLALADLYRDTQRCKAATTYYRQALKVIEKTMGPKHSAVAAVLAGIGQCDVDTGSLHAAIEPLERAARIEKDTAKTIKPRTAFALARALWTNTKDQHRATKLARVALSNAKPDLAAAIRSWLATHDRR